MQLMSVSPAARHLGYKSRSQLYKLINDGWLDGHVHIQMPSGQRLLDVDGLQGLRDRGYPVEGHRSSLRWRSNPPAWKRIQSKDCSSVQ